MLGGKWQNQNHAWYTGEMAYLVLSHFTCVPDMVLILPFASWHIMMIILELDVIPDEIIA